MKENTIMVVVIYVCMYLFILGIPVIKQEEGEEGEN